MDKYRINYKCIKVPKPTTGLEGFELERVYAGRSFNGYYEVSADWGSGKKTQLITKQIFDEYFELAGPSQLESKLNSGVKTTSNKI